MPSKTICLAPPPSAVNNLISGSVPALLTTQTQDAKTVTALGDSVKESPKTKSRSKYASYSFLTYRVSYYFMELMMFSKKKYFIRQAIMFPELSVE